MLTLLNIQDYMSKALRGETSVSPAGISAFAEDTKQAVGRQLTEKKREYRIRMSGLGRPLCQQVLDKKGIKESMQYNTLFRFVFGELGHIYTVVRFCPFLELFGPVLSFQFGGECVG